MRPSRIYIYSALCVAVSLSVCLVCICNAKTKSCRKFKNNNQPSHF